MKKVIRTIILLGLFFSLTKTANALYEDTTRGVVDEINKCEETKTCFKLCEYKFKVYNSPIAKTPEYIYLPITIFYNYISSTEVISYKYFPAYIQDAPKYSQYEAQTKFAPTVRYWFKYLYGDSNTSNAVIIEQSYKSLKEEYNKGNLTIYNYGIKDSKETTSGITFSCPSKAYFWVTFDPEGSRRNEQRYLCFGTKVQCEKKGAIIYSGDTNTGAQIYDYKTDLHRNIVKISAEMERSPDLYLGPLSEPYSASEAEYNILKGIENFLKEQYKSQISKLNIVPSTVLDNETFLSSYDSIKRSLFYGRDKQIANRKKLEDMEYNYFNDGSFVPLDYTSAESQLDELSDNLASLSYFNFLDILSKSKIESVPQSCKSLLGSTTNSDEPAYWIQLSLNIIKYAGMSALLLLSTFDFGKAVIDQDSNAIKKSSTTAAKRLAFVVILFFLPIIIDGIFKTIGFYTKIEICEQFTE